MTEAEALAVALLAAQADGDYAGMRQMLDHATPRLLEAVIDLACAELGNQTVEQIAEADRLAALLSRASVCSRLNVDDSLMRHQVVHPIRPVATALRWELGDRAADALGVW